MPKQIQTRNAQTDRMHWDSVVPQLDKRIRGDRETWVVTFEGKAGQRIRRTLGLVSEITVGGGVEIGRRSFLGSGCTLRPGVKVGSKTIVGAGSNFAKSETTASWATA